MPAIVALALLCAACQRVPETVVPAFAEADARLLAEIRNIPAIDNHAHPVRPVAPGEAPDRDYDALPVDNLEPTSDPVRERPGTPELARARAHVVRGDPAKVLDQLGIAVMLANRVAMGPPGGSGLPSDRFLWVPYADALMYPLDIGNPTKAEAEAAWAGRGPYKALQDYIFRFIAAECGRLGMAVHFHTGAGSGSYFDVSGSDPMLLEPLLNDPSLRQTNFVFLHGGWPFERQLTALLTKPNAYADFSSQNLFNYPGELAATIRAWLEFVPEKALFATDAYPYSAEAGWEETGYIAAGSSREALAIALTGMLRDGEITRARASELARMVLRDNARALYKLK